jgi:glycine C-acetyltransferase
MVVGLRKRLELLKSNPQLKDQLWVIVKALQSGLKERGFDIGRTNSPVTPVFLKGTLAEATNLIMDLRETYSIFCSIVTYPVIPKGQLMLRLIPSAAHTLADVEETLVAYSAVKEKLLAGHYFSEKLASVNA